MKDRFNLLTVVAFLAFCVAFAAVQAARADGPPVSARLMEAMIHQIDVAHLGYKRAREHCHAWLGHPGGFFCTIDYGRARGPFGWRCMRALFYVNSAGIVQIDRTSIIPLRCLKGPSA